MIKKKLEMSKITYKLKSAQYRKKVKHFSKFFYNTYRYFLKFIHFCIRNAILHKKYLKAGAELELWSYESI